MIRIRMAAERSAHIKVRRFSQRTRLHRQIQMVLFDELNQILRTDVLLLRAERIHKVECVNALLVRHDDIRIIRHPLRDEMMAANGLKPPDFINILKTDAVHLICAVLRDQLTQPLHALARTVDIRQNNRQHIFFADTAFHKRIRALYARVGGDGLRFAHGDVAGVHAASPQIPASSSALDMAV